LLNNWYFIYAHARHLAQDYCEAVVADGLEVAYAVAELAAYVAVAYEAAEVAYAADFVAPFVAYVAAYAGLPAAEHVAGTGLVVVAWLVDLHALVEMSVAVEVAVAGNVLAEGAVELRCSQAC
jgi:hypothetical protein